ncbi:ATP-binding protein [Desulfuromonas carbonis]|uniref:sensor histidine kinase n=1 Tax=Desulfuromonas sp. DDH964 TaxID=1823759 RepID=UPI00078DFBCC|nr:ATP-binding protein [Desulfuromonas sp. DDH964]AMV73603.1 sensor histidine kinase, HAMP domain-containing [Desulfuromonas sp. DDH964]
MKSLRRRLLTWLLLGQLLAVGAAGIVTYLQVERELRDLVDDQLRLAANGLVVATGFREGGGVSSRDNKDELRLQVWEGDRLVFSSPSDFALPRGARPGFRTSTWYGLDWRSYLLTDEERTIQLSQALDEQLETTVEVAFSSIGPVLGLIPVLALLVWFGVGFGMRPLGQLAAALERRRPDTLQPLPVASQPRELQPLVTALNLLLRRLESAMELQRKFIADAAHELRTPLAAVQIQAQLLERPQTDAERQLTIGQIRGGISRAAHLVQQLLILARLAPEGRRRDLVRVDLGRLAREVAAEFAPLALAAGIDLGVVCHDPVSVDGDADSLQTLLGNLIDNAIRYSPRDGQVDIALFAADGSVVCEVRDAGPGIPPAERERVFDRFYRCLGSGVEGSGLGLAIVREIVEQHGAAIELGDTGAGKGLRVKITFPAGGAAGKVVRS